MGVRQAPGPGVGWGLAGTEWGAVLDDTVVHGEQAAVQRRAAGPARQRVGDVIAEDYPLRRQRVQRRRGALRQRRQARGGDGIAAELVASDEEQVEGALLGHRARELRACGGPGYGLSGS